ncbi:MAG: T9SS type A sorting domain-containing protein [Saprospiraceae bacterium]|nr:T9SS type A sorting domain-containing protein [Saprospiraceae bacterium]
MSSSVTSLYTAPPSLDIFPNPCFSSITIQLKTPDPSITTIEITNTLGQSVYEAPIWNGSTIIIDVAEFLPGIYFVVVKSKGQLVTQKIVKR